VTEDQVAAALAGLGGTPAAVAAGLATAGAKGHRHECRLCPVAAYLAGLGLGDVVVSNTAACWVIARPGGGTLTRTCGLPEPVRRFVGEFDYGRYPSLEAAG
jgi:hypothetical protein